MKTWFSIFSAVLLAVLLAGGMITWQVAKVLRWEAEAGRYNARIIDAHERRLQATSDGLAWAMSLIKNLQTSVGYHLERTPWGADSADLRRANGMMIELVSEFEKNNPTIDLSKVEPPWRRSQ